MPRLSTAYFQSLSYDAGPSHHPNEETRLAREKNTARSEARRRTRASLRETLTTESDDLGTSDEPIDEVVPAQRPSMFRMPNVRDDIAALPEMFRTRRLLWLPFILLLGSFFVALGIPYPGLDRGIAQVLSFYVQSVFIPSGLITFLVGGFLAPRAAYLVGALLGVMNAILLAIYLAVRSDLLPPEVSSSEGQVSLVVFVGYALVVGPLAAAFAAWYRGFFNRMGAQGRDRRLAREAEQAKKQREERRAAKRPANSKTRA